MWRPVVPGVSSATRTLVRAIADCCCLVAQRLLIESLWYGYNGLRSVALRQPGVPSMFDSLEVKVLYPT